MPHAAFRFNVGTFACAAVTDGISEFSDISSAFVNADTGTVAAELAAASLSNELSYTCLVVDTPAGRILVDTGSGPDADPPEGELFANLADAGISRDSIDLVVITHPHGDHILGLADDAGVPAFPNAKVVLSRADYAWLTDTLAGDAGRATSRARLLAVAERVRQVEPGEQVVPGVTALDARGHSPGQIALLVESDGERLLHLADAVHHPVQLGHPDWYLPYDLLPEDAVAIRWRLFAKAADEGLLVQTYHFPFPSLGYIRSVGDAWRWEPLGG